MGTETHQDGHWHTTPDASMDWSLIVGGDNFATEGMACVSAANKMRTAHMALTRGSARVTHADSENGIIVIERHYEGPDENGTQINERMIVVVNDGDCQWDAASPYGVGVGQPWGDAPNGFVEVFNSQSTEFGGWPGSGNAERGVITQQGDQLPLAIPKLGVVVLKMTSETNKETARDANAILAELSAAALGGE